MDRWEITWIADDGTSLGQYGPLEATMAQHQVRSWLTTRSDASVWLSRCHMERSDLVTNVPHAPTEAPASSTS